MEVHLTPDQEAFVRQAIETGRFHRVEEAVHEALSLWEERERKRAEFLATLDDAKALSAQGLVCSMMVRLLLGALMVAFLRRPFTGGHKQDCKDSDYRKQVRKKNRCDGQGRPPAYNN